MVFQVFQKLFTKPRTLVCSAAKKMLQNTGGSLYAIHFRAKINALGSLKRVTEKIFKRSRQNFSFDFFDIEAPTIEKAISTLNIAPIFIKGLKKYSSQAQSL
jgi:hypothetical protein